MVLGFVNLRKSGLSGLAVDHSLYVGNGSLANFLLVAMMKEYCGLKDGDKVLVPGTTWMTNVAPIIQNGFEPVFCDINLDNYSFDKEELKICCISSTLILK